MYIPSLFFAATACMRLAYAEFLVATEPPFPLSMIPNFTDTSAASSWTTSVVFNAGVSFDRFTKSLGPSYETRKSSFSSELNGFIATATNYSVPAEVTDVDRTTTFFGKPSWYSALPSGVREFKEQEWETIKSIASGVIAARLTTTGSKGAAPALATGSVGLKNAGWAVAGAAAAVFL